MGTSLRPCIDVQLTLPRDGSIDARSLLSVSSGINHAPVDEYLQGAIIPREPWRQLTECELEQACREVPTASYHNSVSLIKLPDALVELCNGISEKALEGRLESSNSVDRELNAVFDSYTPYNIASYQAFNAIAIHDAGQMTLTRHRGKKIGLHLDSFDGFSLLRKPFASNRICLNIGRAPRCFLWIPSTVHALLRFLGESDVRDGIQIARGLYSKSPLCPVYCMRCPPGYGYCAPTENILHDGSTTVGTLPDVSLSIRGYFSFSSAPVLADCGYSQQSCHFFRMTTDTSLRVSRVSKACLPSLNRLLEGTGFAGTVASCRLLQTHTLHNDNMRVDFAVGTDVSLGYEERYRLLVPSSPLSTEWRLCIDGEPLECPVEYAVLLSRDREVSATLVGRHLLVDEYSLVVQPSRRR